MKRIRSPHSHPKKRHYLLPDRSDFPIGARVEVVAWGGGVRLWMVGLRGVVIAHNRTSVRVQFENGDDLFGIGSAAYRYGRTCFPARPTQIRRIEA